MNTEAAIVVTSNFCFVGKWDCEDTTRMPPGGQVVYINTSGIQQTYTGICGNKVVTINAQSIVSSVGVDTVDCGITEFTFDADYAVLTYKFSDATDLDTRTRIVEPNINMNNYLGFDAGECFPADVNWSETNIPTTAIIDWSGDNTGTGYESILVDIQKLKALKPDMVNFVVDLRAAWYRENEPMGVLPVEVKAVFYKGAIDYYEKDIEWEGLAQKRLNKVIDEGIKSKSDVDFTKDLLKYKKYYHCIYVFAIRVLLSVSTS